MQNTHVVYKLIPASLLLLCLLLPWSAQAQVEKNLSSPLWRDLLTWHPVLARLVGPMWYDLGPYRAHATMNGVWAWKGDPTARFAGTLNLNAAGYAEIPHHAAHNFSVSDPFSVSLWMSTTNTTTFAQLWTKAQPTGGQQGYYLFIYADGRISFYLYADNATDTGVQTNAGWNDGKMHHVVASYYGNGLALSGMVVSVDGVDMVASDDCSVCDINTGGILNTGPTRIGMKGDSTQMFTGFITNVMVYNRALVASDVQALYQQQAPTYGGLLMQDTLIAQQLGAPKVKRKVGMP